MYYEEVFDNRPNLWYNGEGNWFELKDKKINEYHIYPNGKLEKFIYDKNNNEKKYKYIYHDSSENEHEICEATINITKEKKMVLFIKQNQRILKLNMIILLMKAVLREE